MGDVEADLGRGAARALDAVLGTVMDVPRVWALPIALLAVLSCVSLGHPAGGGVTVEFGVSATTLGVVALVWLPSLVRAWSLAGGRFEAAGMAASSAGLLGSEEELIERLTGLKTATEKAKEQAPEAAEVLGGVDAEVNRMATEYLGGAGVINQSAIDALARRYQELRRTMPSGDRRTIEMTRVVNEARIRAEADLALAASWGVRLVGHAAAGERVVGLSFLQVSPAREAFQRVLEIVRSSASAFEMFHAVVAVGEMGRLLTEDEKRHAAAAMLDELERDPRGVGVAEDSGLPSMIRTVVGNLEAAVSM